MPGLKGLELRSRFTDIPACIFITAYPEYAVEEVQFDPRSTMNYTVFLIKRIV